MPTAYDVYMAMVAKRAHDLAPGERTNFAAPEHHELPMPDEHHARLAWSMVDKTKDLSPGEKAEAKARIKRRLHHFDVGTQDFDGSPGVNKAAFDTDTANPLNGVTAAGAGIGGAAGAYAAHRMVGPHVDMAREEATYLGGHGAGMGAEMKARGLSRLHRGGMVAGLAAGAALGAAPGVLMALGNKFGEREH